MQKVTGRVTGRYISSIYQSVLNCVYRNDKIQFDWTKTKSNKGFLERIGKKSKKEKTLFRDRNPYLINSESNQLNGSSRNERKSGTTSQ